MKYFGKKSLSSFISGFLHVAWWVLLCGSILVVLAGTVTLATKEIREPIGNEISKEIVKMSEKERHDMQEFMRQPLAVKALVVPYFALVIVLLLIIIRKAQEVFTNFKNDIVFSKANVALISKVAKWNIAFAIVTFNVTSLLTSLFLMMLCEILSKGAKLQEEVDLTV
ncbi:MAG: hypothetical protein JNM63_19025 [Spirochaetia bacterium]|nr:hypothetical protein [Spirochaetia bacterium]